jgi:hypothetical protein
VWFLTVPDDVRRLRLVARHASYGKTPAEAEAWVARVDDVNADLVLATRPRADRTVDPNGADAWKRPGPRFLV